MRNSDTLAADPVSLLGSLNRIIVFAGNPRLCAEFFRDKFSLRPVGTWAPDWAELDAGGCRLAFHQAYLDSMPFTGSTGSPSNPHKIVFTVADVPAARQRLVEAGVTTMGEVRTFQNDDGQAVVLCDGADPEGHVFQLCSR